MKENIQLESDAFLRSFKRNLDVLNSFLLGVGASISFGIQSAYESIWEWIKNQTRQEIITKTQIPNNGNFNIYANYYNLMDKKGLGFQISSSSDLEVEKLHRKNGFEYLVLEHNNQKELYILPNEQIEEYVIRIASKVEFCKSEKEVLDLLFEEMKINFS